MNSPNPLRDGIEAQSSADADARKLCTCDGAGRGPGRACVVKAGGRLGELWRCAQGAEHEDHMTLRERIEAQSRADAKALRERLRAKRSPVCGAVSGHAMASALAFEKRQCYVCGIRADEGFCGGVDGEQAECPWY